MIHRLLADADLKLAIVEGVVRRHAGIDFKRAQQVTACSKETRGEEVEAQDPEGALPPRPASRGREGC